MTSRLILCSALLALGAQDPGELQQALNDLDPEGPWHYNNVSAGSDAAKKSGKPLLIVFL